MTDYSKFDKAVSATKNLTGRKKADKLLDAAKLHPSKLNSVNEK